MPNLDVTISGPEATQAAEMIQARLSDIFGTTPIRHSVLNPMQTEERNVDPIALAALIIAIPGAVLAVADLVDRIAKRKKAVQFLEQVQQITHNVSITIEVHGVPTDLRSLNPDTLLELAGKAAAQNDTGS